MFHLHVKLRDDDDYAGIFMDTKERSVFSLACDQYLPDMVGEPLPDVEYALLIHTEDGRIIEQRDATADLWEMLEGADAESTAETAAIAEHNRIESRSSRYL